MTQKIEKINLIALMTAFERIAVDYKRLDILDVDISGKDMYWVVGTEESFDVYNEPFESMTIGSLDDDLAELAKLMSDPDRPATTVDMETLGNVLRAVLRSCSVLIGRVWSGRRQGDRAR
jgi:hypothetical protein